MKILMVNKFHYIVGGSETYYFALKKLLEENGHQVIEFSMQDEQNIPSKYSNYFVKNADYKNAKGFEKLRLGLNIIYSKEAKKKFEQLILDTQPDIIHLHIFQHQISESILDIIKKYHIPTVYTAHELKMICPNYKMYVDGRICEDCKGGKYYNCIKNKCIKNSVSKSMLCMVEAYVHQYRHSYDVIDKIITPSDFYRNKFIEWGVQPERIIAIPNFLDRKLPVINKRADTETYYLYFGRLSPEKGIMTLLKAAKETNIKLYIVGTGDQKEEIEEFIKKNNADNISLFGFKCGQELNDLVGNAKAVILPSEWYENGPYSVIEALQLGRPIIGSKIGGIPELIDNNGFVFETGNYIDLIDKLNKFEQLSPNELDVFKRNSKKLFKSKYTAQIHYKKLYSIYNDLLPNFNKQKN